MNVSSILAELKRRRVYSVAVAYIVTSWLLIQVATQVFPFFAIPDWIVRLIIWLLIVGFPVAVVCAWALEITPEGIKREENVHPRRRLVRRPARALTALVVLLAAAAAGLTIFHQVRSHQTDEKIKAASPAFDNASTSIAVLPFENLSEDKANAYFVSGMRDEILTSLAQLRALNVRSRVSADKYKTDTGDLAGAGRELGVANVITGSVQKDGDNVLINVQLIETQSGAHLWAQSYRRHLEDLFGVQGEVAQNVAEALRIKLAPEQKQRLLVPRTTNVRAHDLFLRAGDLAGAYLTIADAYRAPREVLGPMRRSALRAVQTDEELGVGHIWLGAVSMLYDRNFPLAKRELQRAVALNPNSADAHRWLGWYLARVERNFGAGREELQRARVLDPLYTWPVLFECLIELARENYQSAAALAEEVMEIDPHFFYDVDPIANVLCAEGRWRDAITRYESLPPALLTRPNFQLAVCYAHAGGQDRAQNILADLEALSQTRYVEKVHLAAIYAALGNNDKAFAALDQACDDRSARVSTPRFYSWLAPLFGDPRFAALEYKAAHSALTSSPEAEP